MIDATTNALVASCTGIPTQRATNCQSTATNHATNAATNSLKALAGAVLERNRQRNLCATSDQTPAPPMAQKPAKLVASCAGIQEHTTADLSVDDTGTAILEAIEERAAIMEFDGELRRSEAERAARSAMRVWQYRTTAKPDTWLVMLCPGIDLAEAELRLRNKFADKLLAVREATHDYKGQCK